MTDAERANLDALHANPIWKVAGGCRRRTAPAGRGLPTNSAVSVALAEAERLAGEGNRAWSQAVADWRAWRHA